LGDAFEGTFSSEESIRERQRAAIKELIDKGIAANRVEINYQSDKIVKQFKE
jgi:hypothetical protein